MHGINSQYVQDVVALIVLIGGIVVYSKGRVPQQTIKNLSQVNESYIALNQTLQDRIANLEKQREVDTNLHGENTKAIARLQGQIDLYKELPLRELAEGIKYNNEISNKILDTLKTTAKINAEDRDVLTNQNLHIKTEVHKIMEQDK